MYQNSPLEEVLVDIQLKQTELAELQRQTQECSDELSRLLQTLMDVSEQHTSPAAIMHHVKEMAEMYIGGLTKQGRQTIPEAPNHDTPEQPQPTTANGTSILPTVQSTPVEDANGSSADHQRSPNAECLPSEFFDTDEHPQKSDEPVWVDFDHDIEEDATTAARDEALEADMAEVAEDQAEAANAENNPEELEEQGATVETRDDADGTVENSSAVQEAPEALTETAHQNMAPSDNAGAASTEPKSEQDATPNADEAPNRLSALKGEKKAIPKRTILAKLTRKNVAHH